MPWSPLVSAAAVSTDTNSATTPSEDTTGASSLFLVTARYQGTPVVITDTYSNTWNTLTLYGALVDCAVQLHYVTVSPVVGSGHQFTVTLASSFPSIYMAAFTGGGDYTSQEVGITPASNGVTTVQPGSITPNQDNCLIISGFGQRNSFNVPTISSPFTVLEGLGFSPGAAVGGGIAYSIQTTATAENPTWTTDTGNLAALQAVFAEGGAVAAGYLLVAN